MGICLDTDQKPTSNTTFITSVEGKFEATRDKLASEMRRMNSSESPTNRIVRNGVQVMPKEFIEDPQGSAERLEKPENIDKILPHNSIHEYYAPTTRIIFILGGPGSGKVGQCENYLSGHPGYVHTNANALLLLNQEQKESANVRNIPTSKATQMIIGAMQSCEKYDDTSNEAFHANLISGYPRDMSDMKDYMSKIGRYDGAIWLKWEKDALLRQVEYGASIGELSLESGKTELDNFFRHEQDLMDYFEKQKMLHVIDAGRPPDEVYSDFKSSVDKIVAKSGTDFHNIVGSLSSDEDSEDIVTHDNGETNGDQTTADKYRRLDSARSYREYKVMEEAVIEEARQHNDIDDDTQNIDIAATKIQAAYRGHRVRAKMKEDSEEEKDENKESVIINEEVKAAAASVSNINEKENDGNPTKESDVLTVGDDEEAQRAATMIQAAYRGHRVRSQNKANFGEKDVKSDDNTKNDNDLGQEDIENKAATRIQAAYRGHNVRSKNQTTDVSNDASETEIHEEYGEEAQNAATKIQAAYKGHAVRSRGTNVSTNEEQNDSGNSEEKPPDDITTLHTIHEENSSNHSAVESDSQSENHPPILPTKIPVLIWIMGGPGSSKAEQVDSILNRDRFCHVNVGKLLYEQLKGQNRNGVLPGAKGSTTNAQKYYSDWQNGELLNSDFVVDLLINAIRENQESEGMLISGFPRNVEQIHRFEKKIGVRPVLVLIDCSEVKLRKNLSKRRKVGSYNPKAYKQRLKIYRRQTLPMLKYLDKKNRLRIVDGDKDPTEVDDDLQNKLEAELDASSLAEKILSNVN